MRRPLEVLEVRVQRPTLRNLELRDAEGSFIYEQTTDGTLRTQLAVAPNLFLS